MIIVDRALQKREEEGRPIRVGIIGAGYMGKGLVLQITNYVPGMKVAAIAARNPDNARAAYVESGVFNARLANNLSDLNHYIAKGHPSITDRAELLCEADNIDVIIEVTGTIEYAANHIYNAIRNRKHVVLMNPEMDGTVGAILKKYADDEGVVFTTADGDQPGVLGNLYRFVKTIGVNPRVCGNIKGLHDPYRNPTTQAAYARQWNQKPHMVTSFADGTKISYEQAIVANATGMKVGKRGMFGPQVQSGQQLKDVIQDLYPMEMVLDGPGIVDYVVGAEPLPGVFILGTHDDPKQKEYLALYKLGDGPLYLFYTPYHLCHLEAPLSAARAVLFQDATLTPLHPEVDVVTVAKKNLKAGAVLDGIGYYMTYGVCENMEVSLAENLLPMGLSEGCVLKRDLAQDEAITYDDVILPKNRFADQLRQQQNDFFFKDNISERLASVMAS